MKKIVRDGQGRPYIIGESIGQGSFGKVFKAMPEDGRFEPLVAKLPFSSEEIGSEDEAFNHSASEVCFRLVREQQRCLDRLPEDLRPITHGIVDGGSATPCLLMEFLPQSCAAPLSVAHHLLDLFVTMSAISRALTPLHEMGVAHGNLKPGNIFLLEDGGIRFTDPAPESPRLLYRAVENLPGWSARMAPELRESIATRPLLNSPAIDTFSLGKIFVQAIVEPSALKDARVQDGLFEGAVNDEALTPFMAALEARFEKDQGNPHTKERFLRRTRALVIRLLSLETSPSPPYRFYRGEDLAQRFEELRTLFHPSFEQMGPILLDRPTGQETFQYNEPVRFSLSFKCQGGLKNPDLLNFFVYVRDLKRDKKVENLSQEVLPVHEGDRFRCEFVLSGLEPGQFLLRVGMGLKGTPGKPIPRDVLLLVEPKPLSQQLPEKVAAPKVEASLPKQAHPSDAQGELTATGSRFLNPTPIQPIQSPGLSSKGAPSLKKQPGTKPGQSPQVHVPAVKVPVKVPAVPSKVEVGPLGEGDNSADNPEVAATDFYNRGRGGEAQSRPSSLSPLLSNKALIGLGAILVALMGLIWAWMR